MSDEQIIPTPPVVPAGESTVFGLSVRAVVLVILTFAMCAYAYHDVNIKTVLATGFSTALGFYFGKSAK